MRTVIALLLLIAAMLAGAFGIHNIWEWFSLVSEGRAGDANVQSFVLSLLLLIGVIAAATKVVDWISDSQPHGGR
jgi:hypothetical protein